MFVRIFGDDALLHSDALPHHLLKDGEVRLLNVEGEVAAEHGIIGDESVLQHLGITAAQVLRVEGLQELRVEDDGAGSIEDTNLILQASEVDARFTPDAGIDHGQQRRGDVDVGDAALEGGGGEAPEVRNHATAQVDEHGMARGTTLAQCRPHGCQRVEVLGLVGGGNGDE